MNDEAYSKLMARTLTFNLEIIQQTEIVAVTHASVIRSLNALINKIPLEMSFDLKLPYREILKLK